MKEGEEDDRCRFKWKLGRGTSVETAIPATENVFVDCGES